MILKVYRVGPIDMYHLMEDEFQAFGPLFCWKQDVDRDIGECFKLSGPIGTKEVTKKEVIELFMKYFDDIKKYPHRCPKCQNRAYIGFSTIDCFVCNRKEK